MRNTGGFVGLLVERATVDQILELHDTRFVGNDRHREGVPIGKARACFDFVTVGINQRSAIRQTVDFKLTAIAVEDDEFTVTRHRQTAFALVDDRRQVAVHDLTRR